MSAITAAKIPSEVPVYPVSKFTGGAPLDSTNMAAAIRAAWAAAQLDGGGRVTIPAGTYYLGTAEIVLTTASGRNNSTIQGAGMDQTILTWDQGFSGAAFKLTGTSSPAVPFYNGGVSDLTITCATAHASNTGTGIHIESCVNTQFRNITIRNFLGCSGLKARKLGADGTNQYCELYNFTVAGCKYNYDLRSFVNCQGYGVYSNAGATNDFLVDDCKMSIYGGNMQTSATSAAFEMSAGLNGGNRVVLYDFYYEGTAATMFKCGVPGVTFNQLDVYGFHVGGIPTTFIDVDAFTNVTLMNIYGAANATTILKARNGSNVTIVNSGDPIGQAGKFDLDSGSRAALRCIGYGTPFNGGDSIAVNTPKTPASAAAAGVVGQICWDSCFVYVCTAANTWKRAAIATW